MEQNKKTVPTSTVLIGIAFLALFIILPPVTRVLYAEEEKPVEEENPISAGMNATKDDDIEKYTLTCSKEYNSIGLSIISTSEFIEEDITSNQISFDNLENITDPNALSSPEDIEKANEFFTTLNTFNGLDEFHLSKPISTSTYVLLDLEVVRNLDASSPILNHFKNRNLLQKYYESIGYTCFLENED